VKIPDIIEEDAPDEPAIVDPFAKRALVMTTAVCWPFLFAAGYATFQASAALRGLLFRDAGLPAGLDAIGYLLVLLAFAAPALPLAVRWGRDGLVVRAGAVTLLAGLVISALVAANTVGGRGFSPRAFAPPVALAIAAGSVYLSAIVGLANRRAVAGGLVGALLVHKALPGPGVVENFAIWSALICLLGLGAVWAWHRAPGLDRSDNFERRAGGMRLRGALALGALLYVQLDHDIVIALRSWLDAGDSSALRAVVAGAACAAAWLFVVRGIDLPRHRALAMAGAAAVTIGIFVAHFGADAAPYGALVAVVASLMLIGRALAPSSGRRSGRFLIYGLLLFAILTVGEHLGRGGFVWTELWLATAGIMLIAAMYLTPKPPRSPAPIPDSIAFGVAALIPILNFLIAR